MATGSTRPRFEPSEKGGEGVVFGWTGSPSTRDLASAWNRVNPWDNSGNGPNRDELALSACPGQKILRKGPVEDGGGVSNRALSAQHCARTLLYSVGEPLLSTCVSLGLSRGMIITALGENLCFSLCSLKVSSTHILAQIFLSSIFSWGRWPHNLVSNV
jgi:hypothetical protein